MYCFRIVLELFTFHLPDQKHCVSVHDYWYMVTGTWLLVHVYMVIDTWLHGYCSRLASLKSGDLVLLLIQVTLQLIDMIMSLTLFWNIFLIMTEVKG